MAQRIVTIFLVSLCLYGFTNAQGDPEPKLYGVLPGSERRESKPSADIQFDQEPPFEYSGDGKFFTSDDEDYGVSGSGSGSGFSIYDPDVEVDVYKSGAKAESTTTTTTTTTLAPVVVPASRTDCERQRALSKMRYTSYVPRCDSNGDYKALQCIGAPGTSDCFCVDRHGREITGTKMDRPNFPNCEDGYNLSNCTYQMVKSARLLGSRRPECTPEGLFKKVQCIGSTCHCVDQFSGQKKFGTDVHLPDRPNCGDEFDDIRYEKTTRPLRPDTKLPIDPMYDSDSKGSYDGDVIFKEDDAGTIDLDQTLHELPNSFDTDDVDDSSQNTKFDGKHNSEDQEDPDSSDDEDNISPGGNQDGQKDRVEKAGEILTQPGILAGIIGGAVVFLLCLTLLIMFVVYRMRKKDEGSYPLDEPRRGPPNYSYVRAPDKEYYA